MQEIIVKMGDLELTTKPGVILIAPSLGSCVGLAVYDQKSRIAGMVHIVLPDSNVKHNLNTEEKIGKYADIAIPALLGKMLSLGSKRENLIIKIAGGAQMFNLKGDSSIMNIGAKNIEAVENAVKGMNLVVNNADTGGNTGRTLKLNAFNGNFYLKVIGQQEIEF
ncbi:MAG: hypothetical protein A2Y25_11645 [Candidatus Melainabacteria bacterium GWF2_37_15]|nr:MAG: hypothetical protein A2Y25_11645 [Candidatus Melainabacteria bacterium GWF2_37_15]